MYCLWCDQEIIVEVDWNNLFFPDPERKLCKSCEGELQLLEGKQCSKCGRLFEDGICGDCLRWEKLVAWRDSLIFNQSVYTYNDRMKDIIAKWKYRGDYVLREIFAERYRNKFSQTFVQIIKEAVLVPVPLSDERLMERGFNQAEALAQLLELPYEHALTRIHGEKQSKKSRKDRINSENPFHIKLPVSKPVILIDDIYTTGVTLRHAANLLKEHGAKEVYSFTLIRG